MFERGKKTTMEIANSDTQDPYEGDKDNKLRNFENTQLANILKDIKFLINNSNDPKKHLVKYINRVEMNMKNNVYKFEEKVDEEKIKSLIEKHPYFKNPCNYHIRLLTIMKYLKKKGININQDDMDLVVDRIIQQIDGVKKVGDGRYIRLINGKKGS